MTARGLCPFDIAGWFSPENMACYRDLVHRHEGGRMVEVGVWKGRSLASVLPTALALEYAMIAAVDTWQGSPDERDGPHREALTGDVRAEFIANMTRGGWLDRIVVIQTDSLRAARMFRPRSLDLVFLDADHATDAVAADVVAWQPALKPGGTLAGHDSKWPSVRAALDRLFPKWTDDRGCWYVTV